MCACKRVLALVFLVLLTANWLPAESLKAGIAKVDITPPVGVPLWGYELRDSTGTLDPLYARVLVLEVGEKCLALVTLDLGRTFGRRHPRPLCAVPSGQIPERNAGLGNGDARQDR